MLRPPKYVVSDDHRFVYFVVQKVACSSIKTALLPLFGLDGVGLVRADRSTAVHRVLADSPYEIRGDEFWPDARAGRYDGYFKFAFVRNPWDRLVSCWTQKLAPGARWESRIGQARYGGLLYPGMPFAEFVRAVAQIPDEDANPHFRSQHIAVTGNGFAPDFVGRFEKLEEDFAHVAGKIGAPGLRLPHLTPSQARGTGQASSRDDYRGYYDPNTVEIVGSRFAEDVRLFGYQF